MNAISHRALATRIEAAILAIPGVTAVFRTGTPVSKLADAGAKILGIRDPESPLVTIESSSEHFSVDVTIGVAGDTAVTETVTRLHAVIDALVCRATRKPAEIRITVAHIQVSNTGEWH